MSFNAFPYVVSWAVLACIVAGIGAYKLVLYARSNRNEFAAHLLADRSVLLRRAGAAHREEVVDKLGKLLTAIAVAYGLVIVVLYMYSALTTHPAG
jgi:hypothetical protein